jgi:SAM-dependent methyltransferase
MSRTVPCRSCGSQDGASLVPVLDLGRTPLANRLLGPDQLEEPEPVFPLELALCPGCTLLQITETVPPEVLFRDYLYFSSYSDTMLRHCQASAERLIGGRKLGPESLVVEAASNDGYMLQFFARRGVPVLGIEPARNIAKVAREHGIPTVDEFFGAELAARLADEGKRADLFLGNNVLAHVADLNGFVRGIRALLAPDGRSVIEAPYAKDMLDHVEFDTIYHEHLCYFTLTALDWLFRRHGLEVVDVERVPIHGGSLRFTSAHAGATRPSEAVVALLEEERAWGVDRPDAYLGFGRRVEELKRSLVDHLVALKRQEKRIAAYGASAKGSTLLNYFGIGPETLDFVVDRSTHKQSRFTPGTRLPIHAPEHLLEAMPDCVLLLTWNFADEILEQQAEYRRRGGTFLIPIPEVRFA